MPLTDEQRAQGWIEHGGGECPVPLDSFVIVQQRSNFIRDRKTARHWCQRPDDPAWGRDCWKHTGEWEDIIAYRPEPEE